jgi:RNA polymerase sigma-70 factor (ECF subfamily)
VHVNDTEVPDGELLARLAQGDAEALGVVFDRHAPAVTRYAWALATERMDVEELVQDTFFTVWSRGASVTIAGTSLLPWLLVTCRNHALNLQRRRAKHEARTLDGELELVATTGDQDARDRLRWVMDEIGRLPFIDRRVCELCLVEGRSYVEAADELGLSVDAVKKRVSRARTRLRKAVADDEN